MDDDFVEDDSWQYPTRDWAEGLYKGWTVAKDKSKERIQDAMGDMALSDRAIQNEVTKSLQVLIDYIQGWHRDAVTNMGMHDYSKPSGAPDPESRSMWYLFRAKKYLEAFQEKPEGNVDRILFAADKTLQDAVKEFGKIEALWGDKVLPQELDLYGMKLVFDDSYDPTRREFMVHYADEAYHILKSKNLDWLWYGILHVGAGESNGVRSNTNAWYMPHNDQFGIEQSRNAARNLAHEVGHRFWFKYMTETERAEFASKFGDVAAVTEYGKTDPEEDFAEVFAHYVDGQDLTQPQIERFRKFLDSHKKRHSSVVATLRALISSTTP